MACANDNPIMPDAAEADQQQIALARPVHQPLQCAVSGDTRTHQGCRLIDRQWIVVEQVSGVGHEHMGRKSAIDGHAQKALLDAEILISVQAVAALAAADPGEHRLLGADQVLFDVSTDLVDDPRDLVSEREGKCHAARGVEPLAAAEIGVAVLDMQVGMTQAAALDADQNLAALRLRASR